MDYRRAETAEEREAIFRLRYQAYLREGAIAPSPSERFADPLDEAANAWIFGVYVDGELASSIRLHVASRQSPDLPALNVFSDLLSPEIGAGKTIIDPTRFVADRSASRRYPELCYVTTRLAWLASEYFHTSLLLATVRAEHQAFYRRRVRPPAHLRSQALSLARQADQPDGARLHDGAGARAAALPVLPLDLLRAPDAVCPRSCSGGAAYGGLRLARLRALAWPRARSGSPRQKSIA